MPRDIKYAVTGGLVFVHSSWLDESLDDCVGPAVTDSGYALDNTDPDYTVLIRTSTEGSVGGALYKAPLEILQRIDQEHPDFVRGYVKLEDGRTVLGYYHHTSV